MTTTGIVFNIQRFTIHDGPGLRTEIFLKGCPLRCRWCGNPESFLLGPQPGVYRSKCISQKKCGSCTACSDYPEGIEVYRGKIKSLDPKVCKDWEACVEECPTEAIRRWGDEMTVEQCMEIIRKDKGFYDRSGGGVTLSGGEALVQSDFVLEIFKACKAEGIHTCLESSFHVNWKHIEKVLPYTDLIISDIKHMDSEIHKEYTGVGNELVLKNLEMLSKLNKQLILRIPVIPKVNEDSDNIEATADFILNNMNGNVRTLQLLSYMRLGVEKYESLGIPYGMEGLRFNRPAFQKRVEKIAKYFQERGIHCLVGTKEKE